jgi:hypothetical protein
MCLLAEAVQIKAVSPPTPSHHASESGESSTDDLLEGEDLSADGPIAQRIRAELSAHEPLDASVFRVAHTGDPARGRGLYVSEGSAISSGTYLFDYEGELIDQQSYDARYSPESAKQADYAVGLLLPDGRSVYIDAADEAQSNLARFMNHVDSDQANVVAWTLYEPTPRVLCFAARDLEAGVELRFDYGEEYWRDRDDHVP